MKKQSPNTALAEKIAEKLVANGLIPADKLIEITSSIASGTMKERDWRLYIELALPPIKEADHD